MSVQTEDEPVRRTLTHAAGVGAVAGIVAGIGMGFILQFGTELMEVIGGLAGQRTILRGWIVHLLISIIYGAVFSAIVAYPGLERIVPISSFSEHVLAGLTYATMIAAVTVAVLPFAFKVLEATGTVASPYPKIPGPAAGALLPAMLFALAHLVYGAILGAVYALLQGISPTR